ncbi:MAG TPA: serine hydrolase domain-containing protein [Polyangia bacterium]|jgi:CubicO group peptidase (beta-lactamase class C family)|nr:serine hydrolase domain-containing protein [Polyangia bacterium]
MRISGRCVALLSVLGLLVGSVWSSPAWAEEVKGEEAPLRNIERLRSRVAGVLASEGVPGAGIALVAQGRVVWAGGVGVADRATGRPVTAETLFRVGSITKSVVALGLLRLVEEGRLSLGARVSDLAPEIAVENRFAREAPVTVAHLLEHTAGFDDMRPNEMFAPMEAERLPLAKVLAINPRSRVVRWRPGSRFSYSNPGYTVAAYIIEKVTGRPYEEYLREAVLEPLGMGGARLRWDEAAGKRLARGYAGPERPVAYQAIYHRPAGNLMASPAEMAQLVRLWLGRGRLDGRVLFSPGTMARAEHSETLRLGGTDTDYGLGNYGDVGGPVKSRGHDGGIDGFRASYRYVPERGVGFVVLVNSSSSLRVVPRLSALLVEELLGSRRPSPPPEARVPRRELERWVGFYEIANPRQALLSFLLPVRGGAEVRLAERRLSLRFLAGGPELELVPLGGDRFGLRGASGCVLRFGYDVEGRRAISGLGVYLEERPGWLVQARHRVFGWALWLLASALVVGVIFTPYWLFGGWRRAGAGAGGRWAALGTRLLPAGAALAFFALPVVFAMGWYERALGTPSKYALGVWALSWAFALLSSAAVAQAVRGLCRSGPGGPGVIARLHGLLASVAAYALMLHLFYYGLIGLKTWAW